MPLFQPLVSFLARIFCSPPVHLLAFSTLLGTQLYQTFVLTKVTFQTLPRPAFTTLQAKLFPLYFRIQTALLVLTIITLPPGGVVSLIGAGEKSHWIPLAVGLCSTVLNLVLFGPRTRQAMMDQVQMGLENRGKVDDAEQPGKLMAAIKRTFSKNHAASIHLNLITLIVTLWHGWILASKLDM